MFWLLSGPSGFTCWISFALVFSFMYCCVQMCCLLDIHLLIGRINGEKTGEFTCIANQGTSIVDYNIASSDLFKNISSFHVEDRDESVHYPLKCISSFPAPAQEIHLEDHACDPRIKYSWDESKIDTFMTKFRERYNSQYDRILFAFNENVEDASNMFIKLFYSAADCMRVGRAGSRTNRNIFASKPWWDTVCESFKNRKMQALRLFRTMGNMINLADYLSLRNNYKNVCRNKKHEYENKQRQKLVDS